MFDAKTHDTMAKLTRRTIAQDDQAHPKVVEYFAAHGPLGGPNPGLYKIVWSENLNALIKMQDEFGGYRDYDKHDWSFVHEADSEAFAARNGAKS